MSDPQDMTLQGQEVKPWERAWDPDEMRKRARQWTLAGDAGMLLYLQDFSHDLLARTHNIQEELNQVDRDAKMTGVKLNNVFNDFIMLANSQFVENRVYDEDVTVTEREPSIESESQEKSKEQREAALIPKINEAFRLGSDVLDSAFEKLDVNEANSSDEDENDVNRRSEVILEPKDPYLHRPLPDLIGSVSFMHNENVGLIDESDDEMPDEDKPESPCDSESEGEPVVMTNKQTKQTNQWSQSESESESDGDLFADKDSDDDAPFKDNSEDGMSEDDNKIETTNRDPTSFMDELSGKIGGSTEHKTTGREVKSQGNEVKPKDKVPKVQKSKADLHGDDLFKEVRQQTSDESDEENSPFVANYGRFSTHRGLFDDDEEGDLFGAPEVKEGKPSAVVKDKTVKPSVKPSSKPTTKKAAPQLFGNDSDEDDDIFAVAAKSTTKPADRELFVEDSSDDEEPITAQPGAMKKKVPTGGVSMFGPGNNPLLQAIGKQHGAVTEESESEGQHGRQDADVPPGRQSDLTAAITQLPRGAQRRKPGIQVLPTPTEPKSNGLFGEPSPKSDSGNRKSVAPSGGDLFADDDDLFASGPASKPEKNKSSTAASKPSLDLFADDDDLFSSVTVSKATSKTTTQQQPSARSKRKVLSLFDDEDEPDDIFSRVPPGGSTKPTASKEQTKDKSKQRPPSHSVFDDDDLFGATNDDDPSVDLFGANSPLSSPTKKPDFLPLPQPSSGVDAPPGSSTKPSGGSTKDPGGSTKSAGGSTKDPGGGTKPPGGSTKPSVGSTKPSGGSTKPSGGSTKDPGGSTKSSGGSTKDPGGSTKPPGGSTKPSGGSTKPPGGSTKPPGKNVPVKSSGLFGDNMDSDDDIFAAATKPTVKKDKKGSSLFQASSDDLFTTSKSTSQTAKSKTPKIGPALFDDDDGDLFQDSSSKSDSSSSKSTTPWSSVERKVMQPFVQPTDDPLFCASMATKSAEQPLPSNQMVSSSAGIDKSPVSMATVDDEDDDEEEEDLFASSEDEKETVEKGPPPAVSRFRPPGAVSMFGGMDPSAILGKRLKSPSPDGDTEAAERGGVRSDLAEQREEPVIRGGVMSKKGADLPIVGGASPGIDFDQPVLAPTLLSVTKTRPRMSGQRRRPTRQKKLSPGGAAEQITVNKNAISEIQSDEFPVNAVNNDVSEIESTKSDEMSPTLREESSENITRSLDNSTNDKQIVDILHREAGSVDLFGEETSKGRTKPKIIDNSAAGNDDIFGDNFDTIKPKPKLGLAADQPERNHEELTTPTITKTDIKLEIPSDVAGEKSTVGVSEDKTKSTNIKTDKKTPASIFDDDIFADSILKQPKSTKKTTITDDLFGGSQPGKVEDIFGNSKPRRKGAAPDGDDIFAELLKTISKMKKINKTDDFDIFGSEIGKVVPTTDSRAEESKDKDVKPADTTHSFFQDTTDIFTDLPPSKPRPTKVMKDAKPNIFSDSDDDLFATKPVAAKPKTQTSKKSAKKTSQRSAVEDIFGDNSPSIFDDPLFANKK